ncbi:LysR family transcriptional regulator [Falsochrobactrum shanghaiense]|uniref:LysR family transcriptional regulator n=1 Tax=Falsochrobactrum shanghaiense TaxID=2201899 RepID=A0A316J6X3_9HYPH|nr:LysR family transcriptional regulator [Falsochrobactrum shanghaiense]PWL16515.1 LysR family transcriptional regulator [Falsochrobactrum shanghaiense]
MELEQLRCFIAVAEELHFGRAAQRLGILPASFGRQIRLLEETLGVALLARTTRSVALTEEGTRLLQEVRPLLQRLETLADEFRSQRKASARALRIGAIDSAAASLIPLLLQDFRALYPDVPLQLIEDKSTRLIPKLRSGRLDIAFVRPRPGRISPITVDVLFYENAVVAMPEDNPLAEKEIITVADLRNTPLIVPDKRSRPHSHDLTFALFTEAGLHPNIVQVADEKQTILGLVAAGIGLAIVPRAMSRLTIQGMRYIPISIPSPQHNMLMPLAVAWSRHVRDNTRDNLLRILHGNLKNYAALS